MAPGDEGDGERVTERARAAEPERALLPGGLPLVAAAEVEDRLRDVAGGHAAAVVAEGRGQAPELARRLAGGVELDVDQGRDVLPGHAGKEGAGRLVRRAVGDAVGGRRSAGGRAAPGRRPGRW